MPKVKIAFCKECGTYTKHYYLGKEEESQDDKAFNMFATIMTLGTYQIAKRLLDDRPKFYECTKCGHISKKNIENI